MDSILKSIFLLLLILFAFQTGKTQSTLYLLPGQGSDKRLFKNLDFDKNEFRIKHVKYVIPEKKEDFKSYARRLSSQIDTSTPYYLIGVSFGGMIATEMSDFLNPEKVIIISSAKSRSEIRGLYKFQKYFPIYKIIPKWLIKQGSFIAQPIFEPDRKKEKVTCNAMLKAKDALFLKRASGLIINWERESSNEKIIHIHGDNDNTLPIKNIQYDFLVENGSHMMTLTRPHVIQELIDLILAKKIM